VDPPSPFGVANALSRRQYGQNTYANDGVGKGTTNQTLAFGGINSRYQQNSQVGGVGVTAGQQTQVSRAGAQTQVNSNIEGFKVGAGAGVNSQGIDASISVSGHQSASR
jgi:hypothetical protein